MESWLKARKEKKLTQKEVAEKAGISLSAYQRYERDERSPSLLIADSVNKVLGIIDKNFSDLISSGVSESTLENIGSDNPESNSILYGMINDFHHLNMTGKKEAGKRVSELTEIQKYQSDDAVSRPLAWDSIIND